MVEVGFKHTSPKWEYNLGTEISFQREEVLSVWWTRALDGQVARHPDVRQLTIRFYVQSHLSLEKWLASVPPATDLFCAPPNPIERAPFPWMWLGSGSSNGWRCSVTGISGCHGVSRRFEKAELWAGQSVGVGWAPIPWGSPRAW